MIKQLKIKGYENHIDSKLDFNEKINIITGSSNTGKSSIVKALNWLINNQPGGDAYINFDLKSCYVKSIFDDNNTIEKYKDDIEHYYKVNNNEYTALRQNVPKQVNQITNFSEMNLQSQFDKFFLLQDTPGEVTRKLNKIINLSIMDKVITKAKSKVNKQKRDNEYLEQETKSLKKQITNFDWLSEVETKLNNLEKQSQEYEEILDLYEQVKSHSRRLEFLKNDLFLLKNKVKNAKKVKNIINLYEKYQKKIEKYNKIILFYENYQKNLNNLNKITIFFDKKGMIDTISCLYDKFLEKMYLYTILEKYLSYNQDLLQYNQDIVVINDEIEQILPIGSICPVCNQIIGEK